MVLDHSDLIGERNKCFSPKPLKRKAVLSQGYVGLSHKQQSGIYHNLCIFTQRQYSFKSISHLLSKIIILCQYGAVIGSVVTHQFWSASTQFTAVTDDAWSNYSIQGT